MTTTIDLDHHGVAVQLAEYEIPQVGEYHSVDSALKALGGPHVSHNSGENEWYAG